MGGVLTEATDATGAHMLTQLEHEISVLGLRSGLHEIVQHLGQLESPLPASRAYAAGLLVQICQGIPGQLYSAESAAATRGAAEHPKSRRAHDRTGGFEIFIGDGCGKRVSREERADRPAKLHGFDAKPGCARARCYALRRTDLVVGDGFEERTDGRAQGYLHDALLA